MNNLQVDQLTNLFPFLRGNSGLAVQLLGQGIRRMIGEQTPIYWEGDNCPHIALVIDGRIRVYKSSENTSREITLYEIGPGETCILNVSCILANTGYPANAIALTDLDVLLLPAGIFLRLMETNVEIRHFIFSLLSQRLAAVMTLLEEVVFNRMDERLQEYLIEKSADDLLTTTHQAIANDLGTSREVVSRLLKDMERTGRVSLARNAIRLLQYS
jgi:CRP/FNR family transcriptional regulator